jgi:protein O-GlcNAc transferase
VPPPLRVNSGFEKQFTAATALHQAGRLVEALAAYQRLRSLAPRDYRVLHLGGTALLQLGRAAEACPWLESALRILPHAAATHMCLGLAQSQSGLNEPAEVHLRAAVRLEPANGENATNLGIFLVRIGQGAAGLEALRRGAELRPNVAAGWLNLGGALLTLGHPAEALVVHERAIALAPHEAIGHRGRAMALHGCHRMRESLAAFDAALRIDPLDVTSASQRLLVLHYLDEFSAADVAEAHRAFGRLAAGLQPARVLPRVGGPDKRLRVAFLSPDLRTHAVACFLEPLLGGLTPDGFELVLYHDHAIEDATSARLRGRAALWRNFTGVPDVEVARQILADAPDVLVDLAGHTGQNRQGLLASRLAPVQITYLGYPDTTGLTTMDFRLTDALADPEGAAEALHTERLVRFAETAWCYATPADAPAVVPPPWCADAGAGAEVGPVFGSFNNLGKLSPSTWRLWARLLAAVPGARLLLKGTAPAPDWVARQAAAVGLDPARVTLLPVVAGQGAHLGCYAQMDVALDAVPYNGTTTTCEALWMGRPVVTLVGDRHVSRVGASLLTAAGQGDCVAATEDEFIERARTLVADRAALAVRSAGLRAGLLASPLMDAAGQGRAFAQVIRECWARGGE